MTRFLTTPILPLAAAAMLSCAAPVLAQTPDTVPSVGVKYSDLNLGSQTGAQAMLKRIEAAATTVCGGAPDIRQLDRLASFEACRRSAVAKSVIAAGSPTLTAMARGGSPASFAAR